MKPYFKKIVIASIVMIMLPAVFILPSFGASILSGYPGYPNTWSGLTNNTIIDIGLDSPVAMIGTQPDISYCVKKLTISGFDYVINDVACDAAASDDRKTVSIYPIQLLDTNAQYAYKIDGVNFQGGGTAQNFSKSYVTGNNPTIPPFYTVAEFDTCTDYNYEGGFNGVSGANYCFRCHVDGFTRIYPWDGANYPIATCNF
ncbi:MAG: hypothetical protein WCQ99_05385 [Pseudomonadota bacterium]